MARTSVVCLGRNANGELGDPSGTDASGLPVDVHFVQLACEVRSVSAGFFHSAAISQSGALHMWGAGSGGQLGRARASNPTFGADAAVLGAPEAVNLDEGATGVAAGRNHTLAVSATGRLFSWGRAAGGQLGHGICTAAGATRRITDADLTEPKLVQPVGEGPELPRFACVRAGEHFSAALATSGLLFTWGCTANGRLGRPSDAPSEPRPLPRTLFGGELVSVIALGWRHVLACTQGGACYSWGAGEAGQLGRGSTKDAPAPALIEALGREKVVRIAAGRAHSIASTAGGLVFAWGENSSGQLGTGEARVGETPTENVLRPRALCSLLDHAPFRSLSAGAAHSAFVSTAGHLFTCGDDSYGQLGHSQLGASPSQRQATSESSPALEPSPAEASLAGRRHDEPRAVQLPSRVIDAACGAWHTVLLLQIDPDDETAGSAESGVPAGGEAGSAMTQGPTEPLGLVPISSTPPVPAPSDG